MGAVEALENGVERVIVSSANAEKPITSALQGAGTHIFGILSTGEGKVAACFTEIHLTYQTT